jgi:hypothetical protein
MLEAKKKISVVTKPFIEEQFRPGNTEVSRTRVLGSSRCRA